MTYPALQPHEAAPELARFRIVDVREPHEYEGPLGHIAGAESAPLATLREAMETANRDQALLLVCRSGARSGKACELLVELGFGDVTNLAGGMIEWRRRALPVAHRETQNLTQLLGSLVAWMAQVTASSRPEVETQLGAYLGEAGASLAEPTAASVDHALERVSELLREQAPPADLDLVIDALRGDLAAL